MICPNCKSDNIYIKESFLGRKEEHCIDCFRRFDHKPKDERGVDLKTYRFQKWGVLFWYKGLPVYAGTKCITPYGFVLWWPWNWIACLVATPFLIPKIIKAIKDEKKMQIRLPKPDIICPECESRIDDFTVEGHTFDCITVKANCNNCGADIEADVLFE